MTEEEIRQALDEINKEDHGRKALEILNIISYFAPEKDIDAGLFLTSIVNEEELEAATKLLKQHSIIDLGQDKTTLIVSKFVQKIIQTNPKKQMKNKEILKIAAGLFDRNMNSSNVEHAMSVWCCASRYQELIKVSSELPTIIVDKLRDRTKYKEANVFGREALDLLRKTVGKSHPATLNLQHRFGIALGAEGNYTEALETLLPLYKLYKKKRESSDKKEVLESLSIVARELCNSSRLDEALPLYRELLTGSQVSETRDSMVLIIWQDYADLLSLLDRDTEALEILGQVLIRRSEILGRAHQDTLDGKSSMASIFTKQSRFREAFEIYNEIVDSRTTSLGEHHIDTLRAKHCLASLFLCTGQYDKAQKLFRVLEKKFKQILGSEHPDTVATQANLGSIYDCKGEYGKALDIYKDVCEKQTKAVGPKHDLSLKVKRNVGQLLLRLGKYDEALRTFEAVHRDYHEAFGPEHPDTVAVNNTLKSFDRTSSVIYSATKEGDLAKLRSLIKNGLNINNKDVNGNTPLHYAAVSGHINIVRLLLESGAIHNIENKQGKTPLQLTEDSTIKNLLESVAKLFTAVKATDRWEVAELIAEEKSIVNAKENNGTSLLHLAVHFGDRNILKLLLENGADASTVADKNSTPLHFAASEKNNIKIVELLLQHVSRDKLKSFIDAKTMAGNTALHAAAKNGSLDIVISLLQNGGTYCITTNEGKTPLDVCEDRNIRNWLKLTEELFECAKNGNVAGMDKLRSVKPDELIALRNTRNGQGNTLMQVATANQRKDFANALLETLRKPTVDVESKFESLELE